MGEFWYVARGVTPFLVVTVTVGTVAMLVAQPGRLIVHQVAAAALAMVITLDPH
ncbi:hypothetical protein [Curtobacterium sp. 24E2]|nr:hypothetical protein JN350_08630 [Curtobacterium sp. 24E2]